jgi:hypothetical protein
VNLADLSQDGNQQHHAGIPVNFCTTQQNDAVISHCDFFLGMYSSSKLNT